MSTRFAIELLGFPDLSEARYFETLGSGYTEVLTGRLLGWFELLSPQVGKLTLSIRYIFEPRREPHRRMRIFAIFCAPETDDLDLRAQLGMRLLTDSFGLNVLDDLRESVPVDAAKQNLVCLSRRRSLLRISEYEAMVEFASQTSSGGYPSIRLDELMLAVNEPCFIDIQVASCAISDIQGEVRNVLGLLKGGDILDYGHHRELLARQFEETDEHLRNSLIARVAVVAGASSTEAASAIASGFGGEWLGSGSVEVRELGLDDLGAVHDLLELGLPFIYPDENGWFDKKLKAEFELNFGVAALKAPIGKRIAIQSLLPHIFPREEIECATRLPIISDGYLRCFPLTRELESNQPSCQISSRDGSIVFGRSVERGTEISLPTSDLTRHGFVAGVTGSGKTVTMMNILRQLWDQGIPFLVLEPAKSEYRGLLHDDKLGNVLRVVTAGKDVVPIGINPFQIHPRQTLTEHLSNLMVAFQASMPLEDWLPTILEEALYKMYEALGWEEFDLGSCNKPLPSMKDVLPAIEAVVEDLGYGQEVADNARAALRNRLVRLTRGAVGAIFRADHSWPTAQSFFDVPTVIELEALSQEHANFITMLLLMTIREELRGPGKATGKPKLVLVLEEAHNLVPAMASESNSSTTATEACRFICRLLAETRALGLSVLVVDQSPAAVAEEVVRGTNLKVAHRTTAASDREMLASSMLMDGARQEALAKIRRGQAYVYAENLHMPLLGDLPFWTPGGEHETGTIAEAQLKRQNTMWRITDLSRHIQTAAHLAANELTEDMPTEERRVHLMRAKGILTQCDLLIQVELTGPEEALLAIPPEVLEEMDLTLTNLADCIAKLEEEECEQIPKQESDQPDRKRKA